MEYKNITIAPSSSRRKTASETNPPTLHVVQKEEYSGELSESIRPRDGSKYRYIKTIGRGGMKVVLEVHDNDTMRNVAMAMLPDISNRSQLERGHFLREARITASLEHPNIVPVHDIGADSSGVPYFTMKLLRGRTLATVLRKLAENDAEYVRQYDFDSLMRIYTRICNAIAFAHSKGILHLDLKPENVQIGDYGEVLVLDWGLARNFSPSPAAERKNDSKTRRMRPLEPRSGDTQVNGTPGYMAPEQISGEGHSCSPQTDIYSLGAILYAMITYENPVFSGEIGQMLRDTLSGNILRPSARVRGKDVPYGIEAVVLKAMSLNPNERYANVRELRDEVVHFVGGFATEAEKAGPLKKTVLFMRRHARSLISGTVILLLTVLLFFFSWREAHRIISLWDPSFSADFQSAGHAKEMYSFRNLDFKELDRGWSMVAGKGLHPAEGQWLTFREPFQENVRIALELSCAPGQMKTLEIALIPAVSAGRELSLKSPMLTCLLHWNQQNGAEILDCRNYAAPQIIASVPLPDLRKKETTVMLEHENGFIALEIDRKEIFKVPSIRLLGNGPVYVAIRGNLPESRIRKLEISRLAPPENATALLAGDTLLEEGLYEKAIRRYLQVDDSRPGSVLAEKALQKAYLAAFKLESAERRGEYMLDIKKRLAAKYPDFNLQHLLTADACSAWQNRDYALALQLINRAFEFDPNTRVIPLILALPHERLPEEIQNMLMKLIRRTRGLKSLDLSDYGLTSLRGIAGLPLISLDCSGNQLTTLKELSGMRLQSLDCSGNRISSLQALSTMPLRYLDCSGNRIRSLAPLKRLPLRRWNFTGNPLADKTGGRPLRFP